MLPGVKQDLRVVKATYSLMAERASDQNTAAKSSRTCGIDACQSTPTTCFVQKQVEEEEDSSKTPSE